MDESHLTETNTIIYFVFKSSPRKYLFEGIKNLQCFECKAGFNIDLCCLPKLSALYMCTDAETAADF